MPLLDLKLYLPFISLTEMRLEIKDGASPWMALKDINKTLKTMWYLKGSQSSVFKNGVIWQNLLSKKTRWATSIHIAIILQFSRMKIQFANTSFIHIVPYTSKLHFSCQVNIIIAISFITIFSLLHSGEIST